MIGLEGVGEREFSRAQQSAVPLEPSAVSDPTFCRRVFAFFVELAVQKYLTSNGLGKVEKNTATNEFATAAAAASMYELMKPSAFSAVSYFGPSARFSRSGSL